MEKLNVTKTRQLNLCVSCEICMATCPMGAITMEYKYGQFLPKVNEEKCHSNCGLCLEVCPGVDLDPLNLRYEKDPCDRMMGNCLESYIAHSKNIAIRRKSTSGGLITNLMIELIKNKDFDAAFVLEFNKFEGKPARLEATSNVNKILKSAGSKYIPASMYNVIKTLQKSKRKYIIVGTPCQIYGIKKFIKRFNINEENLLFLGLFCDKTMNFNIIRYFEDKYRNNQNEKLIKIEFRTKDRYGWPGNLKLHFDSGRTLIVDRKIRIELKKFFQLNRCLFCFDKLNRFADISFGDCYIPGKGSFFGNSIVIIRTPKGKRIFQKYSHLFVLESVDIKKIAESQHLADKQENVEYAKLFINKYNIYPKTEQDYGVNTRIVRRLSMLQKYVKWGMTYNTNKIKFDLILSSIRRKLGIAKKLLMSGITAILIAGDLYICRGRRTHNEGTRRNIIVVGGNLFNKGAQAMTFTLIDQMKRKFPDKNIYLLSTADFERDKEEKLKYNFKILPSIFYVKFSGLKSGIFREKSSYDHLEKIMHDVIKDAVFFVDISGYALSSQWGLLTNIAYLLNIAIAKKYSIPYYILPQSIGPFNYPLVFRIFLYPLLRVYLKYPKRIFVREKEGISSLSKFTKKNVEKSYDIVLLNKNCNINNIYRKKIISKKIRIAPNSVGIIPNMRVIERAFHNDIYSIYMQIINRLVDAGKNIYLVRHSYEDLEACEIIKSFYLNNDKVKLIHDDLNTFELEKTISQFDFVVASRYHSIIHAYKNGVPALVIGWATKYFELMKSFDQLDYFFDVRKKIDVQEIISKLNKMIHAYKDERRKIINKVEDLQSKENSFNIFNCIED